MFGKIIEQELLGTTKREVGSYEELGTLETKRMGYEPAILDVKRRQRGDPYHPGKFFPRGLCAALRSDAALGMTEENQLAYYTAINSALDLYHGVDAFFEYTRPDGKMVRVTIDVTTNPHKDRHRADVILEIPSEGLDPKDDIYQDLMSRYTEQIKGEMLTKEHEHGYIRKTNNH